MDAYLGSHSPLPMHCSGENFFDAAKQAMPGRVVRTSTGTRFTFGTA